MRRLLLHLPIHNTLLSSTRTPMAATTTTTPRALSTSSQSTIPPNAWDSHMHVADPRRFPPAASATYTPHAALLPSAQHHARKISIPNLVFVQPSTYGFDNACLLSALRQVGPNKGRGVVVLDPEDKEQVAPQRLREWHELGVRGLRVNLKSVGRTLGKEEMAEVLGRHADVVRPMGTWVLQVYADLKGVRGLADLMPKLGVKVVVDHLGSPGDEIFGEKARRQDEDWTEFMRFLELEGAYTKVSGPYRFSKDPEYRDLESIVKEVLRARGGRAAVFASDWPHTRFEGTDITPWVQRCVEWCGKDEKLRDNLFRDNAHVLWDVE